MENRLPAEMWDKMQYLFRHYYDRMVHAVLHYDGLIDERILKQVIIFTTEKVPVLHSSFNNNPVGPYWQVEPYSVSDILTVVNSDAPEREIDRFITGQIPVDSNVQYRVLLVHSGQKSSLCILVNHMCFDGGDLKYFLKRLADNYTKLLHGDKSLFIKTGSRSYEAVYTKMNPEEEKIARGLYKNISQIKDEHYFPFTPSSPEDKTRIRKRKISREKFAEFRAIGKTMGVTVNDLMLAVYIHSLYDIGQYSPEEMLTIPCMVDLRRHIAGGEEAGGLTNHTGFMQCTVQGQGKTVNDTLVDVLHSVRKSKEDKYIGLYSLPLLKLAYTVFPFAVSEQAIKLGYLNPLIGMSNIGILDPEKLKMGEARPVDGFLTGAAKYKPYMQLALTTLNGEVTMTIAVRGNEEDDKIIESFFDCIHKNIESFIEGNKHRLDK